MKVFEIYKDEDGILNFEQRGEWIYTLRCSTEGYAAMHLEHLQKSHDRMQQKNTEE